MSEANDRKRPGPVHPGLETRIDALSAARVELRVLKIERANALVVDVDDVRRSEIIIATGSFSTAVATARPAPTRTTNRIAVIDAGTPRCASVRTNGAKNSATSGKNEHWRVHRGSFPDPLVKKETRTRK
jgi:hypothetical protein